MRAGAIVPRELAFALPGWLASVRVPWHAMARYLVRLLLDPYVWAYFVSGRRRCRLGALYVM